VIAECRDGASFFPKYTVQVTALLRYSFPWILVHFVKNERYTVPKLPGTAHPELSDAYKHFGHRLVLGKALVIIRHVLRASPCALQILGALTTGLENVPDFGISGRRIIKTRPRRLSSHLA
jgi:hypothetical protein